MADIGHVDADLVLAAREQVQEQQCAVRSLLHEFPLGCGPLAAIVNGAAHDHHAVGIMQPTLDFAGRIFHHALDHGDIASVDDGAVPVGGHLLLHVNALGIDHEARCAGIQAVYHMGGAALACLGKMAVEQRLHVQAAGAHRH